MSTISAAAPIAGEAQAAPVSAARRIDSLDVLRGFAVLGILIMNIQSFALPMAAYMNPTVGGRFDGADYWVWVVGHLLADLKFMSIFSMLFGAGVILFTSRLESKGLSSTGLHYRRMGWLLLIGMLHAYLLWYGDILVPYALCGMVLFWVRKFRPSALLSLSIASLMVTAVLMALFGFSFGRMQTALDAHDAQAAAIVAPAEAQSSPDTTESTELEEPSDPEAAELLWGMPVKDVREQIKVMRQQWSPSEEELNKETTALNGSYVDELIYRAPIVAWMQVFILMLFGWRILSMMLLGMALFKWGVLSASRSAGAYLAMVVLGFGVGLPLIWIGLQRNLVADFDFIAAQFNNSHFNYFGSVFVSLGWIGVIMLLCRSGAIHWLAASLGAVGRMAFTNYIMHTVVCTTIFYNRSGLGLAKYEQLNRVELLGVVGAIFVFQMIASPIWLRSFRFGPLEWIWRSLTYWKLQPMRR